jgi:hypothetical protein
MTRALASLIVLLALAVPRAWADDPQLDAAKAAFDAGKAAFDAGKLDDALAKFKESYQLSKSPFLLYNIGHTYDARGDKAKALYYFQQFLAKTDASAPLRDEVQKRVDALQKEGVQPDDSDEHPAAPAAPTLEIQHKVIDSVPPGLPIDVTAAIPTDTTVKVTLFYRGAGEEEFTAKPMAIKGPELSARIPAEKVFGTTLQYYIEARGQAGAIVGRVGKRIDPNIITIDTGARPHYTAEPGEVIAPLRPPPPRPAAGSGPEGEPSKLRVLLQPKWIATGATGILLATAITTYVLGGHQHDSIANDSTSCGAPPCRPFDTNYDAVIESRGERYNTIYRVSLGLTVVAAGVAGYFWYRDLFLAPAVTDRYAGATAAVRF